LLCRHQTEDFLFLYLPCRFHFAECASGFIQILRTRLVKSQDYMVYLLMIAVGLIGANSLVLSPIAAEVAKGLSIAHASEVMDAAAAYGVGVALSALLLAPLADRVGADRALRQSLILMLMALAASALAPNLWFLVAAQAVLGIGVGMAIPAVYSLAALIAAPGEEARTIGKVLTGWTLSMVGGVTFSAIVAEAMGWRAVFGFLAAGLLLVLALILIVPLPRAPKSDRVTSPISALRVPGILPALFSVAMLGTGFYGIYNFLGAHIVFDLGQAIAQSGWFTLTYGIGFGAAMLLDPMLDRVGPRRGLMAVFTTLIGFYVIMHLVAGHFWALCAAMFFWGVLQHLGLNLTVGRLSRLDVSQRGAVMGLNSAVMYMSVFGGTILYRPVYDSWGLGMCMLISAALALGGASEAFAARWKDRAKPSDCNSFAR
jgi:predicted MFS family arabinose efflux permease